MEDGVCMTEDADRMDSSSSSPIVCAVIDKHIFRSAARGVSCTEDMVRVTLDMSLNDWRILKSNVLMCT